MPWPVRAAAEWTWRGLLLALGAYLGFRALASVALVTLALVAAVLLTALLRPAVDVLCRLQTPRLVAAVVVFLTGLVTLALVGWFVTNRFANRVAEISSNLEAGVAQIRAWLRNGPLDLTAAQVEHAITAVTTELRAGAFGRGPLGTATLAAEVLSGFMLTLFLLFFFLYDSPRLWAWVVRLFPRRVQDDIEEASRHAWATLTGYVRGTVLVAFVDGFCIGGALVLLGVPLAVPLGVLTLLGAFVPLVGATLTGAVAVLVALVTNGLTTALLVLGAVLLVQQLEGNVLAPVILGRAVRLHPVAIVLVIAVGGLLAGIAGAVVAVPLAAVTNTVVAHLGSGDGRRLADRAARRAGAAQRHDERWQAGGTVPSRPPWPDSLRHRQNSRPVDGRPQ